MKFVSPHASSGSVVVVLQQLRKAQHGFKHHSQRAQSLHKQNPVQKDERYKSAKQREAETKDQVVFKRTPAPEIPKVQIYRKREHKTIKMYTK